MSESSDGAGEIWTTLRAYAAHKGVRLSAVQKAIASGRIKPDALRTDRRGRNVGIEQMRADRYWAENTDPAEAARNGHVHTVPAAVALQAPAGGVAVSASSDSGSGASSAAAGAAAPHGLQLELADVAPGAPAAAPNAENDSYLAARARKEHFSAKSAEVDYLQSVGILVEASAVTRNMTEILTQLKTSVMHVADKQSHQLAVETDPVRVQRILSEQLRSAFDECSRHFADIAAGGAEGRAETLS